MVQVAFDRMRPVVMLLKRLGLASNPGLG